MTPAANAQLIAEIRGRRLSGDMVSPLDMHHRLVQTQLLAQRPFMSVRKPASPTEMLLLEEWMRRCSSIHSSIHPAGSREGVAAVVIGPDGTIVGAFTRGLKLVLPSAALTITPQLTHIPITIRADQQATLWLRSGAAARAPRLVTPDQFLALARL
jgi:hypothetical protein